MRPPDAGRGRFRLAKDARLIVLPKCSYCGKVAPECECGYPGTHKKGGVA